MSERVCKEMKRYNKSLIISLASLMFIQVLVPTPSQAATEGCPNSWTIDTNSKIGVQELVTAKNRLGSNMALDEGRIEYSSYSGEFGPLKGPSEARLTIEDVLLYGNTKVQIRYNVQVKDCQGISTFVIQLGTLKEFLGISAIIQDLSPTKWASSKQGSFTDFTKANQFEMCVKSLASKSNFTNGSIEKVGSVLQLGLYNRFRQWAFNNPCGLIQGKASFQYFDLSSNCRWLDEQSTATYGGVGRLGVEIPIGKKCEVAFGVVSSSIEGREVYIFERFTLASQDWQIKMICVKGKSQRVVRDYRGYEFRMKCPAGYKKK